MGLFSGILDKKACSICGGEIGLLGNRKLEDGNLCKSCASQLSPFFSERRHSTVDQIREQLCYREANRESVANFVPTRVLGNGRKVLVDEPAAVFIVTASSRWRDENPDVIALQQVMGCTVDVREQRSEIRYKGEDGQMKSYDPPRYDRDYDIWVTIQVDTPYFDEIELKVNEKKIESQHSPEYRRYLEQAEKIRWFMLTYRELMLAGAVASAVESLAQAAADAEATADVPGTQATVTAVDATGGMTDAAAATAVADTADATSPNAWTCQCGVANTGKFCTECGSPRPDGPWTCQCGTANTGKFCSECGSPRA